MKGNRLGHSQSLRGELYEKIRVFWGTARWPKKTQKWNQHSLVIDFNPYVLRLFLIVFFFGKLVIKSLIEDNTLFAKFLLSVINIDWAFSSCSAWAIKSDATHFGSFLESATTTISEGPAKCLENKNNVTNFVKYLDYERFGYAYDAKIQSMDWVIEGQNKTLSYLDKIYNLLNENNINLEIVYYPSAIDILNDNKDTEKSNHFNFLKDWSSMREIPLIDTSKDFFKYSSSIQNYKQNHILCDMHWNSNGNKIIAKNILDKI